MNRHSAAAPRPIEALPMLLPRLDELLGRPIGSLAVFLDYDGTLSPIVEDPAAAVMAPSMRDALERLAARCTVAVVSGRDLQGLRRFVGLEQPIYVGSHGFEIEGAGMVRRVGAEFVPDLDNAEAALKSLAADIPGAELERKRYSLAVHYRRVPEARRQHVHAAVREVLERRPRLRHGAGKMVHEIRPAIDWDKGKAVLWLIEALGLERARIVYVGDDITDEDAFRALRGRDGLGVVVKGGGHETLADFALADTIEVECLLKELESRLTQGEH